MRRRARVKGGPSPRRAMPVRCRQASAGMSCRALEQAMRTRHRPAVAVARTDSPAACLATGSRPAPRRAPAAAPGRGAAAARWPQAKPVPPRRSAVGVRASSATAPDRARHPGYRCALPCLELRFDAAPLASTSATVRKEPKTRILSFGEARFCAATSAADGDSKLLIVAAAGGVATPASSKRAAMASGSAARAPGRRASNQ